MCTQYFMDKSPELRPFIEAAKQSGLSRFLVEKLGRELKESGTIRPTDIVPAVASKKDGSPSVFPMAWGYTNPRSASPLVNCRSETAASKPFWRESWERHRCVLPASCYFEWEHSTAPSGKKKAGQKYAIQPAGQALTFLAGIYHIEERNGVRFPVFAVLTKEPVDSIRFIHDRMPVILSQEMIRQWISPDGQPDDVIKTALTEMYYEPTGING